MFRLVTISLLTVGVLGCVHATDSPPAFTETWYDKTQDAMAEDRARRRTQEILLGDQDDAVTVRADESGRPRLQVGKDRIHADVDVKSGDPRVRLRYKLKWGYGEKDMPGYIPKIPAAPESTPETGEPAAEGE